MQTNEIVTAKAEELFFTPRTDVYETTDALYIVADVPGARDESVNVTFEGEKLTIEARVEPTIPEGLTLAHHEYRVGNYRRVFTVHTPVDRDAVGATLADGVLKVTLPKAKEAKPQRIQIKAG
jgi:HSP20 family protein